MKKIYYISALCLSVLFGSTSCKNEVSDIFDNSAAERLEMTKSDYTDFLTKDGGKWAMSYFTNTNEAGYTYVCTFNADGSVKMSGKNIYICYQYNRNTLTNLFKSETSLWEVIADNGPVLTFNSYNPTFHIFSSPYDIPGTQNPDSKVEIDETGYGHEGDYEFVLMEKVDDNTVRMQGKKWGYTVMMHRLSADVDDEAYLTSLEDMQKSIFSDRFSNLIMTAPDGSRYVANKVTTSTENSAPTLQLNFYPEDGDPITQTVTKSIIVTDNGIRLIEPFLGVDSIFSVQEFKFNTAHSYLVCESDGGEASLKAQSYATLLTDKSLTWRFDDTKLGGRFATAYQEVVNGVKAKYPTRPFQYFQFSYSTSNKTYALGFRAGTGTSGLLYGDETAEGSDKFSFSFLGTFDSNGRTFYNNVPAFDTFLSLLGSSSYTLSSESEIMPTTIKVTSDADSNDYFYVNVQ